MIRVLTLALGVFLLSSCSANGLLPFITAIDGVQIFDRDLELHAGQELRFHAGSHVRVLDGVRIVALDGASIFIEGTSDLPVTIEPFRENGTWGGLTVSGSGHLSVTFADIAGGPLVAKNGATLTIEDSLLHDYLVDLPPIVYTVEAASANLTRVHLKNYYEINFARTLAVVDDSLLEDMIGDGVDFDNAPVGTLIKNSTIRNANTWNVDGVDFGVVFYPNGPPSQGSVENCLIYDITDKGVSVGEGATLVTVQNSLIHHVGIGISAKDGSHVVAKNSTLADNNFGINLYEERSGMGGGVLEGEGLVVLGNLIPTQATDGAQLELTRSGVDAQSDSIDNSLEVYYLSDPDSQFTDWQGRGYTIRPESSLAILSEVGYGGTPGSSLSGPAATDFLQTPLKVAIYGDTRDGDSTHTAIVRQLSLHDSPDIVIHVGDMVSDGSDQSLWNNFHDLVAPLRKIAPFYPVPGNHENEAQEYYDAFELPTGRSTTEKWYSLVKEQSLFLMINTNILARATSDTDYQNQMAWIESELSNSIAEASPIRFRFVVFHYPIYTLGSTSHPDPVVDFPNGAALANLLTDPRWKIDMAFSGHDHFYERQMNQGTAWMIIGGGGAPLHNFDSIGPSPAAYEKTFSDAILEISSHVAKVTVRDLDQRIIDTYEVTK